MASYGLVAFVLMNSPVATVWLEPVARRAAASSAVSMCLSNWHMAELCCDMLGRYVAAAA
jgi:hypothetical protein